MSPGVASDQFVEKVNPDFICSICYAVLYNPSSTPCDHHFCDLCIRKWLQLGHKSCPTCRYKLSPGDLKPITRLISNILGGLRLRCPNQTHGCEEIITYQDLEEHEDVCLFDLTKLVVCRRCGVRFRYADIDEHMKSCIAKLYRENDALRLRTTKLEFERNLYLSLMVLFLILCVILVYQAYFK